MGYMDGGRGGDGSIGAKGWEERDRTFLFALCFLVDILCVCTLGYCKIRVRA